MFAKEAENRPMPANDLLFMEPEVYEWRALDEFSVACFYSDHHAEGLLAVKELLRIKSIPQAERDRIEKNLEYYTTLTLLEKDALNLKVLDDNGLDRFKNGIFVDSFNDFTGSDVSNPEYSIAIDSKKGQARPKFVLERFHATFNSSTSTNAPAG